MLVGRARGWAFLHRIVCAICDAIDRFGGVQLCSFIFYQFLVGAQECLFFVNLFIFCLFCFHDMFFFFVCICCFCFVGVPVGNKGVVVFGTNGYFDERLFYASNINRLSTDSQAVKRRIHHRCLWNANPPKHIWMWCSQTHAEHTKHVFGDHQNRWQWECCGGAPQLNMCVFVCNHYGSLCRRMFVSGWPFVISGWTGEETTRVCNRTENVAVIKSL